MSRTYIEGGLYPVSARPTSDGWESTQIAYEDYSRMSTQRRKQSGERRLPTPDWAVNNGKLRQLLVAFMEERAGFRKAQKGSLHARLERAKDAIIAQRPRRIETLDGLCVQYVNLKKYGAYPDATDEEVLDIHYQIFQRPALPYPDENGRLWARRDLEHLRARQLEIEIEGLDTYLCYTANGGADKIAALVYLYYRVGLDSVGTGQQLDLKPPHVRQILYRLHETWEQKFAPKQAAENDIESKDETGKGRSLLANAKNEPENQPEFTGAELSIPIDFGV